MGARLRPSACNCKRAGEVDAPGEEAGGPARRVGGRHDRTVAGLRDDLKLPDSEIEGYLAYEKFFDDMRLRLRKGSRDTWVGDSPSRAELEELLGDRMMIDALFEASIADVLDEFVGDQRLKDALFGQGVIGTFAGPRDPGTASVKLMHFQGDLEGEGPVWGYVKGGMGMISFAIADAARDAGAVLAAGVPVAEIMPGQGVRLDDGTVITAPTVVSNADPKRLLGMVTADAIPESYRNRLQDWDIRSPVVKFNAALDRAKGDVVVRVDGHCVIAPDYVSQCVTALAESGADNVGGRMEAVGAGRVAEALGVHRATVYRRIQRFELIAESAPTVRQQS